MLRWLKAWREIARLRAESRRVAREIERTTGEPPRLSPKALRHVAKKAQGMSPRALRKHSSLHPDDVEQLRAPSERVVLRINKEGTIEFLRNGRPVAKLNGAALNGHKDELLAHSRTLNSLETMVQEHDKTLKDHDKTLKVVQKHMLQDRGIR